MKPPKTPKYRFGIGTPGPDVSNSVAFFFFFFFSALYFADVEDPSGPAAVLREQLAAEKAANQNLRSRCDSLQRQLAMIDSPTRINESEVVRTLHTKLAARKEMVQQLQVVRPPIRRKRVQAVEGVEMGLPR